MYLVQSKKPLHQPSSGARPALVVAGEPSIGPASSDAANDMGLAGKLLRFAVEALRRGFQSSGRTGRRNQLRVIETLHLGTKKQVLLISCSGERFLVGTGADAVDTIVRLRPLAGGDEQGSFHRNLHRGIGEGL